MLAPARPARERHVAVPAAAFGERGEQAVACRLDDLEPRGLLRLLPDDGGAATNLFPRNHVADAKGDEGAAAQPAVDREI
jgi:hypothetical protein